jgi:hypothetical protein
MHSLILNGDLKRLFEGAACVTAAGLMLGLMARPELRPDMGAPRLELGAAGARADHATDETASWTSYGGAIPDYVIGTDWSRPQPAYLQEEPFVTGDGPEAPVDEAQVGEPRQVSWQEPPREPAAYPSLSGGAPYDADLPPPPEPPDEEEEGPAG